MNVMQMLSKPPNGKGSTGDELTDHPRGPLMVHEASHLFMHLHFGSATIGVTLSANGAGEVQSYNFDLDTTDGVFRKMIATAAGGIGEALFCGSCNDATDRETLTALATKIHGLKSQEGTRQRTIARARREARKILEKHEADVRRLGKLLLDLDTAAKTIRSAARH